MEFPVDRAGSSAPRDGTTKDSLINNKLRVRESLLLKILATDTKESGKEICQTEKVKRPGRNQAMLPAIEASM
jgi:hypothetical protein